MIHRGIHRRIQYRINIISSLSVRWFLNYNYYYHNKCVLRGRVVDFAVVYYIYYDHNTAYIMYHCCYYIFFFHNFPRPTIILYCTSCYYDHRPSRPCRTISGVSLIARFRRFCFVSFCLSNIAIRRRTRNIILHSGIYAEIEIIPWRRKI